MARRGLLGWAIGASAFFVAAPGSVAGLLPFLISAGWQRGPVPEPVRGIGLGLVGAGLVSVVESFVRFVVQGEGTPAPVAPPKQLVVTGQYRHVRNPMYVALVTIVSGQALWLGNWSVLEYAGVLWVFFHLRVVLGEEPALVRQFGEPFERYRRNVPRWIPRWTGWQAT
jgi:protein-S-isoprenylcysteine O-methyltransferase Ste14